MIRRMNKEDQKEKDQVYRIWEKESKKLLNFVEDKNFWSDIKNEFKKEIKNHNVYVWKKDGLIKGFIIFGNRNASDNYIFELFVDSDWQRKGIGTALLYFALAKRLEERQNKSFITHVYVRNFKAVNWYFARGFVIANTHEPEPHNQKQIKYKMVWPKPLAPADPG